MVPGKVLHLYTDVGASEVDVRTLHTGAEDVEDVIRKEEETDEGHKLREY